MTKHRNQTAWPNPWRMLLLAACAVVLCSCRGPAPNACHVETCDGAHPITVPFGVDGSIDMDGSSGEGTPYAARNEYLRDGGDAGLPAEVDQNWEVRGVEMEDTIAHFDTVDGQRIVVPSNRVEVYSPRFGAVRQVTGYKASERVMHATDATLPIGPAVPTTLDIVASSKQQIQLQDQVAARPVNVAMGRRGDGVMSMAIGPLAFQDALLPFEDFQLVRTGTFDSSEMARLTESHEAAVVWTREEAVQIMLDHQAAMATTSDHGVAQLFTVKEGEANPQLRITKLASTKFAEPGDEVAFTIRFDNVGDQVIGNVTIIDNLTTRLEYIDGSGECDVDAEFLTEPNEGGSLVIRCEVNDPVEPGEGGVVRFRCKVR